MERKYSCLFGLIACVLFIGFNAFAADGDLIVNGNVGIGTTTPAQKLDVTGQMHATGDICTDAGGGKCLSTAGTGAGMPSGAIIVFGGSTAPDGFLICNGQAVSRTTYANLFAVIGTTFGAGDGSTTFNIPNLKQKFPIGKSDSGAFSTLGATGAAVTADTSANDLLPVDGTGVTASSYYNQGGVTDPPSKSCDNNAGTTWLSAQGGVTEWLKIDLVTQTRVTKLTITPYFSYGACVKDFVLEGSNDNSSYTALYSGTHANTSTKETYEFANDVYYRYYRLSMSNSWDSSAYKAVVEWELFGDQELAPSVGGYWVTNFIIKY